MRPAHRQKAAGIRRLLVFRHNRGASLLQPLGATGASVALRARSAVAVITAVPAAVFTVAVAPLAASEAAFHVGQDGETALLPVVQRLVERVGGVGDLLHCRSSGGHRVAALT